MAKPENAKRSLPARFSRLGADIGWASQAAARSGAAQRAMTRSRYGLGVALAVVAAFIVQSAMHGFR